MSHPRAVDAHRQRVARAVGHRDEQALLGGDRREVVLAGADPVGDGLQVAGQPRRRRGEAGVDDVGHESPRTLLIVRTTPLSVFSGARKRARAASSGWALAIANE